MSAPEVNARGSRASFAVAVGALALAAGCGGRLAPDAAADSGISGDAATDADGGYEGGWCSFRKGPVSTGPTTVPDGSFPDVTYCGYENGMWRHCSFMAGSKNINEPTGQWACCYPADDRCCPTAETSGVAPKGSCNGYGPGK